MMAVSAAIFAVLESMNLDPFEEEIILATGFFVCIIALARFYFWPKIYLMLQGGCVCHPPPSPLLHNSPTPPYFLHRPFPLYTRCGLG